MEYPTLEQVADASIEQINEWYEKLDAPGESAVLEAPRTKHLVMDAELKVMKFIISRKRNKKIFIPAL